MNILIEYIHTNKSSLEHLMNTECYSQYHSMIDDTVTCCFVNPIDNQAFRLPDCSVTLLDVLMFSKNMVKNKVYDCLLEVSSFKTVELYTNDRNSIRGLFWSKIPKKYVSNNSLYKEQQCIEINGDIILIASFNTLLFGKVEDGTLIEIIPLSPIGLRTVKNYFSTSQPVSG